MIKQSIRMGAVLTLLFMQNFIFAQSINLNSTANFVFFSTDGPLANTGTSAITGDVGTNNGTSSGFATLVGTVHDMNGTSALAASDLLSVYNQLNNTTATLIPVTTMGNGQLLVAGAYSLTSAATLNNTLTLDGQSNSNAVFIIQIKGAFTTAPGAVVNLINGALACNVFWVVEGVINLSAGSIMKGTMIANNAAINLYAGVVLEGRALSTSGAIGVDGVTAMLPTGCGTVASNPPAIITQPVSQTVCPANTVKFKVIASGSGLTYQWRKGSVNLVNGGNISGATSAELKITNTNASDIVSNYNVLVNGTGGPSVNSSNVSLALSSALVITGLPTNQVQCPDYPVYFSTTATGSNLTYQWRKGLVNLTNGNNIAGATGSLLTIDPMYATDVATDYNVVISSACAPDSTSANVSLKICQDVAIGTVIDTNSEGLGLYPNPFSSVLNIVVEDEALHNSSELRIYDNKGAEVARVVITKKHSKIDTGNFPAGIYFYKLNVNDQTIRSGKLIAK